MQVRKMVVLFVPVDVVDLIVGTRGWPVEGVRHQTVNQIVF